MSRNKQLLTCKICGKQAKNLGQHLYYSHPNISAKEYYDLYLKQPNEGVCATCGKPTVFRTIRKGYAKHCSAKCNQNDRTVREKQEQTNLIKYDNKYACATTYAKEKSKQTKKERYGDEKYNNPDKMKRTKLNKYGDENYVNNKKAKKTCLKKYGYECSFQSREVRLKAIKNMQKNGNRSSLEDYLEQFFIDNNINYQQEYKETRYPYFCDFYIPDTDTFIEINNYWTHNNHFYDETNDNDIQTLKEWQNKANSGKKGYLGAIYVWSILDVQKRQCAIKNKLNYIVLWNKKDIDNFISLYKI